MNKVYYFSNELIILEKLYPQDKGTTLQGQILRALHARGVQVIYDAHEIWFYNDHTKAFEAYKNKSGTSTILAAHLEDNGVNIRADAATLAGQVVLMRFCDEKDEFIFKLKYQ